MNVGLPGRDPSRAREVGFLALLLAPALVVLGPLAYAGLVDGEDLITTRLRIAHFKGDEAALAVGLLPAFVLLPVAGLLRRSRWCRHPVFGMCIAAAALAAARMWQRST